MLRILWCTDSTRNSDPDDVSELSDIEVEACCRGLGELPLDRDTGNGTFHSGLVMTPTTASRYTCRSVPDIDWFCWPLSIPSSPTHHLLRMFIRRSKSSGRIFLQDESSR